jgi:PhnB protein
MSVVLNPYLNFMDNSREVLEFYKSIFGGELTTQTFGEANAPVEDIFKDLTMHGDLVSDHIRIMAADSAPHAEVKVGNNINLSLSGDDDSTLSNYFTALSEGGTVTQPLVTAPWGDKFGMVVDKFGINWFVNITGTPPAA